MSDPYADRTHDDAGEPLCTATPLANPPPANCLASALIDITRTAASAALSREYSEDLPPAQPETT